MAHNGMMNTILGLLAKGEINCAGENIAEQQDIFAPTNAPEKDSETEQKPRPIEQPTTGSGKVKTAEEKAREAEEEERRRREREEEEERKRKEEEEEEHKRKEKKGPSITSRLMKWLGTFTEPDE